MIYDNISALQQYRNIAPQAMDMLLQAIPELDVETPNGKTVLIEDKLFILIQRYNTRSASGIDVENHQNFADLQMLLAGNETICYADVSELNTLVPYDPAKDCALFAAETEKLTPLALKPGNFTIFFPGEGHQPCCGNGSPVVKAVIKIHRSLLV